VALKTRVVVDALVEGMPALLAAGDSLAMPSAAGARSVQE
jgi:hypothetical protein